MHTMAGTGPLKNSYMASGSFYKPEVVLDNVARSQQTDDGVIEFKARDITGRIGISKNSVIIGGVVDGTGETGIAAVCKLLLLPYADYTFRRAVPVDLLHLQQDLNLRFDEAKTFLQGPSSIGLASPSDHVLSNMRPSQATGEFGWETTSFRSTFDPTAETAEVGSEENVESYGSAPQSVTGSYLHDCNKLLDAIDKKRQDEIHVLNQPRKTYTDIEILNKPGPLPSRKQEGLKVNVAWAFVGILIFLGLAGFSMISKPVQLQSIMEETAQPEQSQVAQAAPAPAPTPSSSGTAPFSLPSDSGTPPPNPAASNEDAAEQPIPVAPTAPTTTGDNLMPAPAASAAGNQEVNRCMEAVRREPGNVDARRKLAYAYLVIGDSASSVEQYYQIMRVQKVDASDIIQYADNMMVFCGRNAAKQFLTDMLRSDPAQTSIRQKLATL